MSSEPESSHQPTIDAALATWADLTAHYQQMITALEATPPDLDAAVAVDAQAKTLLTSLPEPATLRSASAETLATLQAAVVGAQDAHRAVGTALAAAARSLRTSAGALTRSHRGLQGYATASNRPDARYLDTQR